MRPTAIGTRPPDAPPSRDGVGASRVVVPLNQRSRVVDFLAERFPHIGAVEWQGRLGRGDVLEAHGRVVGAEDWAQPGGTLFYFRAVADEPSVPGLATVLYRDERIVIVDKPHGLAVMPAGRHLQETLLVRLRRSLGIEAIAPVHRIDRDTAGLVLFSLQAASRAAYHALFRERRVEKTYEAIAPYRDDLVLPQHRRTRLVTSSASFMQMEEQPGEPNAETRIALLERRGGLARYELRPETGQRHQLRVHLAALGVPIVNDRIYPTLLPDSAGDDAALAGERQRPLQLLARRLAFTDPSTGRRICVDSRLRLDFPEPGTASLRPPAPLRQREV